MEDFATAMKAYMFSARSVWNLPNKDTARAAKERLLFDSFRLNRVTTYDEQGREKETKEQRIRTNTSLARIFILYLYYFPEVLSNSISNLTKPSLKGSTTRLRIPER